MVSTSPSVYCHSNLIKYSGVRHYYYNPHFMEVISNLTIYRYWVAEQVFEPWKAELQCYHPYALYYTVSLQTT